MHVIAAGIAIAGAFVWLRYSPLPRILCLLMPFTFFLLYQYAVIARCYVFAPVFALGLLALYQNRKSSALLFCVVAGLFANCSVHLAALSIGLACMYFVDRLKDGAIPLRRLLGPAAVLFFFVVIAASTALPSPDGSSTASNPVVAAIRRSVSSRPGTQDKNVAGQIDLLSGSILDPPPQNALAQAVWRSISVSSRPGSPHRTVDGRVLRHALVFLAGLTGVISTSNILALGFLLVFSVAVTRAGQWLSLLPWAFLQACNVLITGEAHHLGLLWIAIICAIWAVSVSAVRGSDDRIWRNVLYISLLIVVILQIGWSVHAFRGDIEGPYSGDEQTAAFLATVPKSERVVAFDDDSVTVNAYLPRSPYSNQRVAYWPFSRTQDPSLFLNEVMATRPEIVSVKTTAPEEPVLDQWVKMTSPGTEFLSGVPLAMLVRLHYRETHRFCGRRFFRDSAEATDCRVIFELTDLGITAK
jgi:hypothetical protein